MKSRLYKTVLNKSVYKFAANCEKKITDSSHNPARFQLYTLLTTKINSSVRQIRRFLTEGEMV